MPQRKSRPPTLMKVARAVTLAAVALAVPVLVASCASERPPRSFVQPNVLKKSDFQGTFYYLQTVTDAPPTNGSMFIGQSSSLLKIRFDIEENFLYARRAFPQIDNSESAETLEGNDYLGQPLAAWRISSQFDIIRQYSSTTGEQTNEIIEDQERPWQQREFFRVDWSQNLITDYVGLGLDLFFSDGQPKVEPVSFWESDPTKPDALHMEHLSADQGGLKNGDMTYLDITDQMIVTPEQLSIDGFSFPKCFMYYADDDCASQVVKVRHSFAKIDPSHKYEPLDWDGTKMNLFGVWDVGLRRLSYNREYGITNTGFSRHAARFNVWSQDSYKDATHLNDDPTTLKPRKIAYYAEGSRPVIYNGDSRFPDGYQDSIYPPELWPEFVDIVGEWNSAMKQAVADRTTVKDPSKVGDVFVPCHNPVAPGDDAVCSEGLVPDQDGNGNVIKDKQGNPILHARQGDPRRSCVFWVDQEQAAGPLGYGPPLYDEQTGETISGQAYIYGAALEWYATRSRDLLLLLNGEVSANDFIAGQPAIDWVNAHGKSGVGPTAAPTQIQARNGSLVRSTNSYQRKISDQELLAMSQAMNFDWAKAFTPKYGYPQIDPSSVHNLMQSLNVREKAIYNGFFSNFHDVRDEQLSKIAGTPIEKMMISPELLAVNGISPNVQWDQLSDVQKALVSPMRWKQLSDQLAKDRIGAEMRGVDFEQFDDSGMQQRLQYYLKKYNRTDGKLAPIADQIRVDLDHTIFRAVTLHEVGHNMGCRHNFRASYDALNYQPSVDDPTAGHVPGYWELRVGALNHPDAGMEPSDGKLHPRYVNKPGGALTQYEINNQIQEMQYASIMDYGSEFYSDLRGLGMYDKALIKFSYAGYVEVFTDAKSDPVTEEKISALHAGQSAYGFPSALANGLVQSPNGPTLAAVPYQTYPSLFNTGADGIYKRADVPYSQISSTGLPSGDTVLVDDLNRPLVPYYFCSDEFVGNLTCQRFDAGADAYEQAVDIISRYKNFYLYNNFKRDKQTFHTTMGYLDRIASRYFDILREQLTWYVLLRSDFQSFLSTNAQQGAGTPADVQKAENSFFVDENGWGNFTAAIALGYETLGDVITTPDAGVHYKATAPDGTQYWKQINDETSIPGFDPASDPSIHIVNLLDGKYPDTTWDFQGCGYYWADECQTRIGYLLDKEVALNELSQSQAYFTGRDTSTDVRQYAIGYVIPFKPQLEEKIGAIFANDMSSLAPQFVQTMENGKTAYVPSQPSWLMDDPSQPNLEPIDPQTGFTLQLWAGVFSLAAFPTTFDHDFINNTQVFVIGNGEAPVPDSTILDVGTSDPTQLVANGGPAEWFIVSDPLSGKKYAAHSVNPSVSYVLDSSGSSGAGTAYQSTTASLRGDIGVRMLERLQVLSNAVQAVSGLPDSDSDKAAAVNAYQNYRENIEVMRALQGVFGYGSFLPDPPQYF